jgi:two-component system, OmpR family, sensor histidine kinase BaeS
VSFRLRVLLLVAILVATSSAATAWLTIDQLSRDISASAEASENDFIVASTRLADYGHLHGGWAGVDTLVHDLGQQLRQRVRVSTASAGTVLADTEPSRLLPIRSTIVDARPSLDLGTGASDDYSRFRLMLGAAEAYPRDQAYAACLARVGVAAKVIGGKGFPFVVPVAASDANCVFPSSGESIPLATVTAGKRCLAAANPSICLRGVFAEAISPAAPPLLRLYIGEGGKATVVPSKTSIGIVAGSVVLVAILCAVLLTRRVLRPIAALTEASRSLGEGRPMGAVPESGRDELANLTRAFNRMAASLARSEERQRRLIGDVAHELRTPLANLRGYLEALSDGVLRPSPELFASLHEEALLQQRIVDDLQELALAEAGALAYHRGVVDLAELAETVCTAFRPQAEAAGIAVTVDALPARVSGDSDRLRQVLGNLIRNALAATPPGGSISIRVRLTDGGVQIEVADTGRGIAPADLPHVFDRFWRADAARGRATGGSGLGLAIAQEIVAAHGGSISVVSGQGTVFTVSLPVCVPPADDR